MSNQVVPAKSHSTRTTLLWRNCLTKSKAATKPLPTITVTPNRFLPLPSTPPRLPSRPYPNLTSTTATCYRLRMSVNWAETYTKATTPNTTPVNPPCVATKVPPYSPMPPSLPTKWAPSDRWAQSSAANWALSIRAEQRKCTWNRRWNLVGTRLTTSHTIGRRMLVVDFNL